MDGLLMNMNLRPLKEPRGMLRVLEFVFGICAFATTCSFSSSFSFTIECLDNTSTTLKNSVTYPFKLGKLAQLYDVCGTDEWLNISGNFSSQSQFFVTVGVLSFLYTLGALFFYCFFSQLYNNNDNIPLVDLGLTFVMAVFWLAGSSAWAAGLSDLKSATKIDHIILENTVICRKEELHCFPGDDAQYSKLAISVTFGFLNLILWGSNLWFLYKDTRYFKEENVVAEGNADNEATIGYVPGATVGYGTTGTTPQASGPE